MLKAKLYDKETQVRFFRYAVVGGVTATVQFSLLALTEKSLAPGVSFTVSFFGAVAVHYLLNRFWALPSERSDHGRQFVEYLCAVGLSYGVNFIVFEACRVALALSAFWAAAVAAVPAMGLVFLLLNFRVFRGQRAG